MSRVFFCSRCPESIRTAAASSSKSPPSFSTPIQFLSFLDFQSRLSTFVAFFSTTLTSFSIIVESIYLLSLSRVISGPPNFSLRRLWRICQKLPGDSLFSRCPCSFEDRRVTRTDSSGLFLDWCQPIFSARYSDFSLDCFDTFCDVRAGVFDHCGKLSFLFYLLCWITPVSCDFSRGPGRLFPSYSTVSIASSLHYHQITVLTLSVTSLTSFVIIFKTLLLFCVPGSLLGLFQSSLWRLWRVS